MLREIVKRKMAEQKMADQIISGQKSSNTWTQGLEKTQSLDLHRLSRARLDYASPKCFSPFTTSVCLQCYWMYR